MDRRRLIGALAAVTLSPSDATANPQTTLIDSHDVSIRETAQRLILGLRSDTERAKAIFDFVRDEIRFGFTGRFYDMKASEVLAARRGFCNNQSTLFAALLHAAGVIARIVFVDIKADILHGVTSPGTPFVDHSYVEVWLAGRWVATDAYIVDPALYRAAIRRLRREARIMGYGVHADGRPDWDGRRNTFVQFVDDGSGTLSTRHFGVHADVAAFYAARPDAWNRLTAPMRLVFPVAALLANRALDRLRAETG